MYSLHVEGGAAGVLRIIIVAAAAIAKKVAKETFPKSFSYSPFLTQVSLRPD